MKATNAEPAESVNTFVGTLSRVERQILMLHYAEELRPIEIGLVLDLSQSQVERMLMNVQDRARVALHDRRITRIGLRNQPHDQAEATTPTTALHEAIPSLRKPDCDPHST
jgi:5-deoxy-D-glucuronate isomerase